MSRIKEIKMMAGSRLVVAIVAAVATAVVIGGAVNASIPDSGGVIHGCYQTAGSSHELKVINSATTTHCPTGYTSLNWNKSPYNCSVTPYVGVDLAGCNLSDDNLNSASIYGADLVGTDLSGANLSGANLTGANMSAVGLGEDASSHPANLSGAILNGANLTNANLSDANLTNATLKAVNLTDANLFNANLTDVNLEGADLTDAGMNLTNFTGAIGTLDDAVGGPGVIWSGATCPDGSVVDNITVTTCVGHGF